MAGMSGLLSGPVIVNIVSTVACTALTWTFHKVRTELHRFRLYMTKADVMFEFLAERNPELRERLREAMGEPKRANRAAMGYGGR